MNNNSDEMRQMQQRAWLRFLLLVIAVTVALFIAFISFFNMPGLQNAETGTLSEGAGRALIFLPIGLTIGFGFVLLFTNRR